MSDDSKYPSQLAERFQIRMPNGLRERIKLAAEKHNRSMNAEIIATLEEAYPPQSIDIQNLAGFLESLAGVSAPDGDTEYLDKINDMMGRLSYPWTVEAGWDGAVTFYPYSSAKPDTPTKADK